MFDVVQNCKCPNRKRQCHKKLSETLLCERTPVTKKIKLESKKPHFLYMLPRHPLKSKALEHRMLMFR